MGFVMYSVMRSTVNFLFAILLLGVSLGCGDDQPEQPLGGTVDEGPAQADECKVGFGECSGAMMCIKGACEPVKGQRVLLTIETAEMPEDRVYWVNVKDRDKKFL